MKNMRDFVGQPMKWIQINAAERTYELRAGNDTVATLRWQKAGGSLALGESADGKWSFKRTGFFDPKVTVRAAKTESDIAVFTPDWFAGRGTLELAGGAEYRWVTTSFWRSQMAFCNKAGQPLVHYKPEWPELLAAAKVEIAPAGAAVSELSLLTVLGWYFMLLMAEDTMATSALAGIATMG
jgi:hypothetical protein